MIIEPIDESEDCELERFNLIYRLLDATYCITSFLCAVADGFIVIEKKFLFSLSSRLAAFAFF